MGEEEKAGYVGGGSFRVDPGRALQLLRSRQLEAPASRIALWIRTAVLRGATRIQFSWGALRLTIRFDGRPLSARELSDPFSDLLAGSPSSEARWFALALLHTTIKKVRVRVESGAPASRRCVEITPEGFGTAEAREASSDTVVVVRWPVVTSVLPDDVHPYGWNSRSAREDLEPCPIRVDVRRQGDNESWTHQPLRPDRRGMLNAEVRQGGARFLFRPAENPVLLNLRFCAGGVALSGSEALPCPIGFQGWAEDPALALDASLSTPVRNAAYRRLLEAATAAARSHALALLAAYGRAMPLANGLILSSPALRKRWTAWIRKPRAEALREVAAARLKLGPLEKPLFARRISGDARRIEECAALMLHLRAAAKACLRDPASDFDDPVKAALWKAPLSFGKEGRLRSFFEALPASPL